MDDEDDIEDFMDDNSDDDDDAPPCADGVDKRNQIMRNFNYLDYVIIHICSTYM